MNTINYLDSKYFLSKANPLIHGVDCPQNAIYLDVNIYNGPRVIEGGTEKTIKDAICIFESNPNVPLRRHHHDTIYAGMADASLVVRYVTDLGSYDYITDFTFY